MKLISSFVLLVSVSNTFACNIIFENEASANIEDHNLYFRVLKYKGVLKKKGYKLISLTSEDAPHIDAFLRFSEDHRSMELEYFRDKNLNPVLTTYYRGSSDKAVSRLIAKLPRCN